MGGGVAWRAPAIMDGGAAGWSAETECCSGGQHLPSACRHRSDQSTPPIPPPSEQPPAGAAQLEANRPGCLWSEWLQQNETTLQRRRRAAWCQTADVRRPETQT